MTEETQDTESVFLAIKRNVASIVNPILAALVFVMVLKGSVVEATQIYGASMRPTLVEGDYIFVNKFKYGLHLPFLDKMALLWSQPQRGDVITFMPPDRSIRGQKKIYIKRVVAIPGDKVEIVRSKLYINGHPVESSRLQNDDFIYRELLDKKEYRVTKKNHYSNFKSFVVPEGHVFTIGDNRDNSYDSRNWGPVPIENIRGKATVIYFSNTIADTVTNLKRIGGIL
jgi:signal peptidase I